MHPSSRALYLSLLLVLIAAGLAWIIGNAGEVPHYGDTVEYLRLARTLAVDQYRTILYPLFLHLCGVATAVDGTTNLDLTYFFQFMLSLIANAIFASALVMDLNSSEGSGTKHWLVVAIVSLATTTTPLLAHFSLSLMSDSIASSLTVAAVGSLARVITAYRSTGICWRWTVVAGISLFLMTLSRVDKLYLGLALVVVTVLWLYRVGISLHRSHLTRDCVSLAIVLSISLISTVVANRLTQTYNPSRPPLDVSSVAFNRVVWPRLGKVYPYLPVDARKLISEAEAKQFDTHNNYVSPLLTRTLEDNPGNKRIINEITLDTLQHFPDQVVGRTTFDIVKYTLPILAFPLELASILPESIATDWTYSRMSMFMPRSTKAWLTLSFASLLLIQLPLALRRSKKTSWRRWIAMPSVGLAMIAIIANALLFGLVSGMDAHIRYALPAFVLEFEMITLIGLMGCASPQLKQHQ